MATATGWSRDGNLPPELTSFVGRAEPLAAVTRHLRSDGLVTITGVGGVGKTRLALRAAHSTRQAYPGGVWFVCLSRLRDPALVVATIMAAIGVADSTRPEIDSLADWLSSRTTLLVLDTCEHLVDACGQTITTLLDRAAGLRVLATSRQPIGLPGERLVPVPPLTPPGRRQGDDPFGNEAVRLFEARASAAVPGFRVTADNVGPVAELCRRLDGIPLAIELAAVRLRTLSVGQILGLLTDRFGLLADDGLSSLPRHRTMRTAIGWSHELCHPAERLLWARLSVFAGDFELDAIRYVCGAPPLSPGEMTRLVAGLVEKSILVSHADQHANVRYRLIDTLREYGAEWLGRLGETGE
ncbi:MAG TPA: NB-ARC domain-containing protein, partial [Thermopolyspora sp.]